MTEKDKQKSKFDLFFAQLSSDVNFEAFSYDVSDEEIELSKARSNKLLMIDIWADANAVVSCATKDEPVTDEIDQALSRFHNHCGVLYKSFPSPENRGLIWECKIAEWILDDVITGDNILGGSPETAMSWFNHLYRDINYSLLV